MSKRLSYFLQREGLVALQKQMRDPLRWFTRAGLLASADARDMAG